jgi:hypothetical protein
MDTLFDLPEPYCFRCGKKASELEEYSPAMTDSSLSPADFVRYEEGTFNPETNRFACTECYIAIGTPSTPIGEGGWLAP